MRWVAILALTSAPAFAIDPGIAKGVLDIGAEALPLTHSAAQLHVVRATRARELRIAMTDREIAQASIAGTSPLPIEAMVKRGEVRGVLIVMDANRRDPISVTVLDPRGASVHTVGGGALSGFKMSNTRVIGRIDFGRGVHFSAPLFVEQR